MSTPIAKHRVRAFQRQNHRCFYCGVRMWLSNPNNFLAEYRLPKRRRIAHLQCTAEHLTARSDGGRDAADNIVAACRFCNQRRHKRKRPPDSESYRNLVQHRLQKRHWHPCWVFEAGLIEQQGMRRTDRATAP